MVIRGASVGAEIVATATDNGLGMRPEVLERIFERSSQPRLTPSAAALASRLAARSHGGELVAASTFGRGAMFMLSRPAAPEQH